MIRRLLALLRPTPAVGELDVPPGLFDQPATDNAADDLVVGNVEFDVDAFWRAALTHAEESYQEGRREGYIAGLTGRARISHRGVVTGARRRRAGAW